MPKPFLDEFLATIAREPGAIFVHYYSDPVTCRSIPYGDVPMLVTPRLRTLEQQAEPVELLFVISHDPLEQLLWWLSALILGVTPGILTPPTAKLDPAKYFADLSEILAEYPNARLVIDRNIPLPELPHLHVVRHQPLGDSHQVFPPRATTRSSGALVFQQSSGTTGLRKGIFLSESAVVDQLESYAQAIALHEDDIIASWLPLYHDMGLVACLMTAVYGSHPLVLTSPFTWLADPAWLFRVVHSHKATLCWLPNFAFNVMAQRVAPDPFPASALAPLRLVINCSEPVLEPSMREFASRFKGIGLSARAISACYAMAETTFAVTQVPPGEAVPIEEVDPEILEREGRAEPRAGGRPLAGSGVPITNAEVRVVTSTGSIRADGEVGEIRVRSGSLMDGYVGVGADERWRDGDGWLITGDIGYQRNGTLFVLGRKNDTIIRGGRNLDPSYIEQVVSRIYGVKPGRTVAVGIPNEAEGTEDVVVLAELDISRAADVAAIREAIADELLRQHGVAPQRIELVRPNWLTKSSSGKPSRRHCREKFQRMLESRRSRGVLAHSYSEDLSEGEKDKFAFFGVGSRIMCPTDVQLPGRIEIGNWVALGRHGKILMLDDFSYVERYARQHFPESRHHFDPALYGRREPRLRIGDGSSIGDSFFIACTCDITIGQFVLISDRVFISDSSHLTTPSDLPIKFRSNTLGQSIVIGDGTWIGINCCIMEGVSIGEGAVVSAGSVVTRDVPANAVVAGNPARVVRVRDGSAAQESVAESTRHGHRLVTLLERFVSDRTGVRVTRDESLLRSGLMDSLDVLSFVSFLEELTGRQIDEVTFLAHTPDSLSDVERVLGMMGLLDDAPPTSPTDGADSPG
jgi:acyl-CoA synthetase (AMP-forming)/AMP-acid ligase II/acetyltransferase-like isoleucine patch superfamily enzyme